MAIFRRGFPNGGVECRWSRQYQDPSRVVNGSTAKCNTYSCAGPWQVDDTVDGKRRRLFFTVARRRRRRSPNVTPKTTEQHLIVCSGKCEAEITIIKDCALSITLLKLTTDGRKVSRGLSAKAELLVNCLVLAVKLLIGSRKLGDAKMVRTSFIIITSMVGSSSYVASRRYVKVWWFCLLQLQFYRCHLDFQIESEVTGGRHWFHWSRPMARYAAKIR